MCEPKKGDMCHGAHIGDKRSIWLLWFTPTARIARNSTPALNTKADAMETGWGVALNFTGYVSLRFEGQRPSFAMDRT
jgi:hypothetical protein